MKIYIIGGGSLLLISDAHNGKNNYRKEKNAGKCFQCFCIFDREGAFKLFLISPAFSLDCFISDKINLALSYITIYQL